MDINVLLAFLDRHHEHHDRVATTMMAIIRDGWATCPLTQNGFIRVVSQDRYPSSVSVATAIDLLRGATTGGAHRFIADDVSLLDAELIDGAQLLGPSQLTDVYLLALAVHHGCRLVTLDRRIALDAVRGADADDLVVL